MTNKKPYPKQPQISDTRVVSARAQEREKAQRRKEYERGREEEVVERNRRIESSIADLEFKIGLILPNALTFSQSYDKIFTEFIRQTPGIPPHPGAPPIMPNAPRPPRKPVPPDADAYRARIPRPSWLERSFGWGANRRIKRTFEIKERYRQAVRIFHTDYATYKNAYRAYLTQLERISPEFKKQSEAYEFQLARRQEAISNLADCLQNGHSGVVEAFFRVCLEQSPTPSMLKERTFQLQFLRDSSELIIDYILPERASLLPAVLHYKYDKVSDKIASVLEPSKSDHDRFREIYNNMVAGEALRIIHQFFSCDTFTLIHTITWNGRVKDISRATGQPIEPCILSVRVPRKRYLELNLERVDVIPCLNHLGVRLSPDYPNTEPVSEFSKITWVDKSEVSPSNTLIDLDTIDPINFEHLIGNLLHKMGYRVEVTPPIKDGGIDVIAHDDRPLSRGKIVVQAKRYQGVVGVAEVRALRGLLIEANAMKGLLITTGRFTAGAIDAANGTLVDLVDGEELRRLLIDHGFGVIPKK